MQLLFEEVFKKIYGLSINKSPITLKLLIRLLILLILLSLIILTIYLIILKKYIIFIVILGLAIIGEISHYIRKNREKIMTNKINQNKATKKVTKDIINPKKQNNKSLLSGKNIKNKTLLKSSKPKNKKLLIK